MQLKMNVPGPLWQYVSILVAIASVLIVLVNFSMSFGAWRGGVDSELKTLGSGLKNVESGLKNVESRLTTVESRLTTVESGLKNVEKQVEQLDKKLDATNAKVDQLDKKLDATNAKVEKLDHTVTDLSDRVGVLELHFPKPEDSDSKQANVQ